MDVEKAWADRRHWQGRRERPTRMAGKPSRGAVSRLVPAALIRTAPN